MEDKLIEFANNPTNDITNYQLGLEYTKINQYGSALTFLLRATELTHNPTIAYNSLIINAHNIYKQGKRQHAVKNQLLHALSVCPERPEAYFFLGKLYYEIGQNHESYSISEVGLKRSILSTGDTTLPSGYPGEYGMLFNKAVAAWHITKYSESREILKYLVDFYYPFMNETYQRAVENNITRLGSGPESQAFLSYNPAHHSNLRYKFKTSEKIKQNYAQVYQDMFILSMLDGKEFGSFLEIGGADPFKGNNTYLLEKEYQWNGASIEYNPDLAKKYRENRRAILLETDALSIDYTSLLQQYYPNQSNIDYLQLDIEPAKNTYEVLLKIPFDQYKFAVITYEHDYYVDVTKSFREKSRKYLQEQGYQMVVNDISPDGKSNFEDWWVHPDLVNPSIVEKMLCIDNTTKKADHYMLNSL